MVAFQGSGTNWKPLLCNIHVASFKNPHHVLVDRNLRQKKNPNQKSILHNLNGSSYISPQNGLKNKANDARKTCSYKLAKQLHHVNI